MEYTVFYIFLFFALKNISCHRVAVLEVFFRHYPIDGTLGYFHISLLQNYYSKLLQNYYYI